MPVVSWQSCTKQTPTSLRVQTLKYHIPYEDLGSYSDPLKQNAPQKEENIINDFHLSEERKSQLNTPELRLGDEKKPFFRHLPSTFIAFRRTAFCLCSRMT